MHTGTVLAGPVEFTPADIAFLAFVIAASALALTAPGWLVLGFAARRRAAAVGATRTGRVWAWIGGAFAGMGVSAVASAVVGGAEVGGVWGMVLAAWASCWGLALALRPRSASRQEHDMASEGWGR